MSGREKTDEEFVAHFWSQVEKTKTCWTWLGTKDGKGYGKIWRRGRCHRAHRVACRLSRKPIADHQLACHHCDNKLCVRPEHIFAGSAKDNMQDWTRKGNNTLINNPHLLKRGDEHWTRAKTKKAQLELQKMSEKRRVEWAAGNRVAIRDAKGRILGSRMVP